MPLLRWSAALLALATLLALGGCSGNYKFDNKDYRPLGEPQTVNRGN